ncbi:unnamed protein product [Diatraea saccharalis]|uniref:Gonadal protein gdl n=1 Tax=Diatraea saccharalis TaxID=40085 RepID=A0A9P0G266_9NEOP|nr:unnamed protein product [Diatraea saccharalis]
MCHSYLQVYFSRKYQMRVPIELLSGLANCLLNDTVFEIVKGLMEIQHVTEKHLFQQRLQVINKHTLEIQNMVNTTPDPEQQEIQKAILLTRHKEELKQTDMKLVLQLDQKVIISLIKKNRLKLCWYNI